MEEPFLKAKPIIQTLMEAGYEAYFVGGSVRDVLLGREIGDVDITTNALPQDVQILFKKTIPVGIEHGTILVLLADEGYEVTTFRIEGDYQDFRHPSKVEFVPSLEQDLGRRDFTINAMAMDIEGSIIDPFGGRNDIEKRFIQTVGSPDNRFLEDPLRMMRAVRFVSQLDFDLSVETMNSIKKNGSYLTKISVERVVVEFEKLLVGKACNRAISFIIELDLYKFLPELHDKRNELNQFSRICSNELKSIDEQWAILLYILHVEHIDQFFKKWKSSNDRIKRTKLYLRGLKQLQENNGRLSPYIVYTFGYEVMTSVIRLYCVLHCKNVLSMKVQLTKINDNLPIHTKKELDISGDDLMSWFGKRGGPWVAETIEKIEKAVLNHEVINNKANIKEWLLCNPQ